MSRAPLAIDPRVVPHLLEVHEESLQLADSIERIVDVVRRAILSSPGIGGGAIFLVEDGVPKIAARIEGPQIEREGLRPLEMNGLARRAMREKVLVSQEGLAAGHAEAAPLRTPRGVEGVVVVAGSLAPFARLFAHAGSALARERTRAQTGRTRSEMERRASAFERTVEVVEGLAAHEDPELLAQRIAGAAAVAGFAAVSVWTYRAEDGLPIEIARARASSNGNGNSNGKHHGPTSKGARPLSLPREAHDGHSFDAWVARLPRWGGCAWSTGASAHHAKPAAGDLLVAPLADATGERSKGFLLAEVASPLDDAAGAEDLVRWSALARLALLQNVDRRLAQDRVEEMRAQKDHEAEIHRMKSQFIAAVSHELKTPLTSITAYAETLRKPEVAANEETRERFLKIVHDESRRLTRIVDDILDLATLEAGRVKIALRRLDLADVLRGAADVIRPLAAERGIELLVDGLTETSVHGDADLLEQLAVNLLENAVKFSEPGGTIRLGLSRERHSCRLFIEDDGPGIPADKLDRVFEQFYQVDGSNTRRHGGAGLGLAICRSIVRWHDGRIWVESEEGRGARFIVSLPRARAMSATSAPEAPTTLESSASTRRVVELVVEMVAEILDVETAALLRTDASGEELAIQAAFGLSDEEIRAAKNGFDASAPITIQGETIGVLRAGRKIGGAPLTDGDRRLLALLADRVALVLRKLREVGDSPEATRSLERALRAVVDVRRHHDGSDVGDLTLSVCELLGVGPEETARIHYAALVRDVGMTRIPLGMTRKPARLTTRERAILEGHPEEGARLLRPIEFHEDVFDIVLAHHETPSGSGYPRGTRGDTVPRGARILAAVDAYTALRAGRPYRPRVDHAEAVAELRRCVGTQFDSDVVEAIAQVALRGDETLRVRREANSNDLPSSRAEGAS